MVAALAFGAAAPWQTQVFAASQAEKRGQELFAAKGCAHCHGQDGIGGGKGPDLQQVRKRRDHDSILVQIHDGGKEMPPFGDELSAQEIDDLIAFLRMKRKLVVAPPKTAKPQASSAGSPAPSLE